MCACRPSDLWVERFRAWTSSGIRAQKGSLIFVAENKRFHHAAKKKGHTITQSTRGEGNAEKKR
jgi:hypothetical protein